MTHHDPVDALTEDARAAMTRACAPVPPDFAAVLARAQTFASEAEQGELAESFAQARDEAADAEADEIVDIRARVREESDRDALDGLIADTRASITRMVEQQRMRAIPPLPTPRPRRRVGAFALAGGLLAAAAIALWSGQSWVELQANEVDTPRDQAFDIDAEAPMSGTAIEPAPAERPRAPRRDVEPPASATPPVVEVTLEGAKPPSPTRARPDADRLRELSDDARRLWREGDRRGAEAKFLQVTTSGGRSALAELAGGDLFALARQLGDDARLAKRWRAYLGKFPRGRYADDARAGLCRQSKRAQCWADYLRDFPDGSYRAEAKEP
jgi:hypothetical protein